MNLSFPSLAQSAEWSVKSPFPFPPLDLDKRRQKGGKVPVSCQAIWAMFCSPHLSAGCRWGRKRPCTNYLFLKLYFCVSVEEICPRAPQSDGLWAAISIFLLDGALLIMMGSRFQGLHRSHAPLRQAAVNAHHICAHGSHRSHASHHIFHTVFRRQHQPACSKRSSPRIGFLN